MVRANLLKLLLLLSLGAFFALEKPAAEDWPQWRGPHRTGHAADASQALTVLPATPKIIWRLKVGEGFASPVVADGKVFYFDNQNGREVLHAIQAADAKELWRAPIDEVFHDEQGPPGPRCTPVVDGERIYAQSGKGELQCLRVADGERLWRANFLKDFGAAFLGEDSRVPGAAEHGYTASPVVHGHRLIACVGGTNGAGVVCFDKFSGKILWRSQDDLAAYAAPVVEKLAGMEQAICFTVEGVIGLGLEDGKLLWRVPLKTSYGRNCTTPVIVDDWVVVGSYKAGLAGIRVVNEGGKWKATQEWVNKEAAMNFSSPVAVGHFIYGLGPARNIVCVDVETGKIAWSKDGYIGTSADVAHAAFIVVKDNILLCTDGGLVVLFAANPAAFREAGQLQVCGLNWCNPAFANGRLYVRDGIKAKGNLYCVELVE